MNFTFSICCLNQLALDFGLNTERIISSIKQAKLQGATYRLGPELEISSYGCQDHFHEQDTYIHSWECLAEIVKMTFKDPEYQNIVCDVGMPVLYENLRYNCRIILLNGYILLIKPKVVLADTGLHRESRWFTPWTGGSVLVQYSLPDSIKQATDIGQEFAQFGCPLLRFDRKSSSVVVGLEICEELWISNPPHIAYFAAGADIVMNASASHHELRKIKSRLELLRSASNTGAYAYANLIGCDAGRICYDGGALLAVCGEIVGIGSRFSLREVQVNTFTINIQNLRENRPPIHTENMSGVEFIDVDFNLCTSSVVVKNDLNQQLLSAEEEIALGTSLWLWDILRRSGSGGFFLCLSGGLDSCSVACIVFHMCQRLVGKSLETIFSHLCLRESCALEFSPPVTCPHVTAHHIPDVVLMIWP